MITPLDFRRMDFPGVLNNCETCHTSGNSATTTYNTVPLNALVSRHEAIDATYAAGIAGGTATTAMAAASLSSVSATERGHVLMRVATLIRERAEEFAQPMRNSSSAAKAWWTTCSSG